MVRQGPGRGLVYFFGFSWGVEVYFNYAGG